MSAAAGLALAVVGRGRAAAALLPRWIAAGHRVVDQRARGAGDGLVTALAGADVVVLAVPDGAIEAVARALAGRPSTPGEVWLHLSGSRPAAVLRDAVCGAAGPRAVGCLHPLVALTDASTSLAGAVAGIEGEPEAVAVAEALARAAGLEPARIDGSADRKMAYHAAAVTVAGHATALFAQALALMASAGMAPAVARRALQPLLASAAANLARGAPAEVATGPIVRGDVGTVRGHLAAIGDRAIAETYRGLGRTLLGLVGERLAPATRAELAGILADE